jgi:hypothetical protein
VCQIKFWIVHVVMVACAAMTGEGDTSEKNASFARGIYLSGMKRFVSTVLSQFGFPLSRLASPATLSREGRGEVLH